MSGRCVQELDREIQRSSWRTLALGDVKEWSSTQPTRLPLSPQQRLKLRDVDIFIIEERCKGCSYCIEFCPSKVLEPDRKLNKIGIHPPRVKDITLCVGCGVCQDICPDFAIYLVDKEEPH